GVIMATEVVMPQMGESIAEGTITKWLKKVGDHVDRDEPLFEISTDKVDAEIPSPAAGTLTDILFKEGDTVEVNKTVAVLDGGGGSAAAPASAEAAPAEKPAAPAPEAAAAPEPKPAPPAPVTPAAEPARLETKPAAPGAEAKAEETKPSAPAASKTAKPRSDNGSATVEELRRTKSSPLVRKIAQEHGVDIA